MIINNNEFLTVLKEPRLLNFGYNPVEFEFKSNNTSNAAPLKALYTIRINGAYAENTEFKLNGITYRAKDNPGFGEFITCPTSSNTDRNRAAEDIYFLLRDDARLNYKYDFIYDNSPEDTSNLLYRQITIIAKLPGSKFNFTFSSTSSNIQGISGVVSIDNLKSQTKNNFGIFLDIYANNVDFGKTINNEVFSSTDYLLTLTKDFQNNNLYNFDISSVLNKYLKIDTPKDYTEVSKVPGWIKNFRVRYGNMSSSTDRGYQRKELLGSGVNYWVCNAAWDLMETVPVNNYYSDSAVYKIQFAVDITKNYNQKQLYLRFDNDGTKSINISFSPISSLVSQDIVDKFNANNKLNVDYIAIYESPTRFRIEGKRDTVEGFSSILWTRQNGDITWNVIQVHQPGNEVKFLSNMPSKKIVNRYSKEYLFFLYKDPVEVNSKGEYNEPYFYARYNLRFLDNTQYNLNNYYDIQQADGGGLYCLDVRTNLIDIAENATGKIVSSMNVSIWKTNSTSSAGQRFTKTQTYFLREDEGLNKHTFIFLNKFGTYDTFETYGENTFTLNRNISFYDKAILPSTRRDDSTKTVLDIEKSKANIYHSGWINRETFLWLDEMLGSESVWRRDDIGNKYIIISKANYEYNSTLDLYNISFETIETRDDNYINE
jgi:hypothetical protein